MNQPLVKDPVHAQEVHRDLNVLAGGRGGDGSLTVITLLGRLLSHRGYHIYSARNVLSRIKGGPASAMVRGSVEQRGCMGDHFDVVVAFDEHALDKGLASIASHGVIIFDSSIGEPDTSRIPEDARLFAVPFGRMAVRDMRRELYKNSYSFGLLTRVLSVNDAEAIEILSKHVKKLPADVGQSNINALREAFRFADELGVEEGRGPVRLAASEKKDRILMSGNHALAFGFMAAGGRFFAGYPITPATDIMEWLTPRLRQFGGVVVQAEDELASINMATGAGLAGVRAMTATSGPGIALMAEGISNLGATEIPVVVVDVQRSGPATGMPTKPEQGDIAMMVHGGNGDFPRIVLAPGNHRECFDIAVTATNLSQRLQCPVFIASDQGIGQDSSCMEPFDVEAVTVEQGKRLSEAELAGMDRYRRYEQAEDGVSPWAVPGTPNGMNLVTGNEHNEWGFVSTDPEVRTRMMDKRLGKIEAIIDELPRANRGGDPGAEIGVISIGMVTGAVEEAVGRLARQGLAVATLQPRTLWPVLEETLAFIAGKERVYVIELNQQGQLASLLRGAGASADKIRSITRYDGLPFRPADIVTAIQQRESDR